MAKFNTAHFEFPAGPVAQRNQTLNMYVHTRDCSFVGMQNKKKTRTLTPTDPAAL